MIKIILIALACIIVVILVIAATKPDTFSVERKTVMKAAADRVFPHINDFHGWGAWSPWEKLDPALKRTFSGAASGKGTLYAWEGNSKVGSGSMEITEATPPAKIVIKLDFIKPFEGHNVTVFTLTPQGDATEVVWTMSGPVPYLGKIMHLFFNMDRMVGGQFDSGLANLKAIVEGGAQK